MIWFLTEQIILNCPHQVLVFKSFIPLHRYLRMELDEYRTFDPPPSFDNGAVVLRISDGSVADAVMKDLKEMKIKEDDL